jgi:hypothetical protein
MQLRASWKALFALITTVNKAGDRNVAGFTGAMDLEASLEVKMMKLVQPFGLLLAANNKKEIAIIHHPHNFGGTLLCPSNKVGCLIGVGPSAIPVMLIHDRALRSIAATIPPIMAIVGCATVNKLSALPPPPANVNKDGATIDGGNIAEDDNGVSADGIQGSNRRQQGQRGNAATAGGNVPPARRRGNAAVGNGTANLKALSCFFPTPFLRNAVLAAYSPSPLELIVATRAAREAHVHAHDGEEEFDKGNIDAHIELFFLWCLGVHQGKVAEMRFLLTPDNGELVDWSAHLHRDNILPSVMTAGTLPASSEDTAGILRSLPVNISCTSEEAENQNKLQREQLDYIKAKDANKKNKAEKWHPTS